MKKFIVGFGLVLGLVAMTSSTALAAEFMGPGKNEGNVTVSATETHRNLYVAGGSVLVNGATTGDLMVAGGNVTIEGAVEQDVTAAAGNVHINGGVGGDIRAAGGTVVINSQVGGDVIVFGGTVQISDRASIGGDLVINGGDVTVSGPVKGKLKANGGNITIDSAVSGEAMINGEMLVFGSKANLPGKVTFRGPQEAEVRDGAQVSSIDYQKMESHRGAARKFTGILTLGFVIKLIAAFLFAFLLLKLLPRTSRKALDHFANKPGLNFLVGLIGLIFIPIATIIVMVTVFGLYIGLAALFAYILLLLLAGFLASVYVGAWISQKLSKKEAMEFDWQAVALGVLAFALLKLIPIIGWIACAVLMLIGFGALLRALYDYQKRDQAA